MTTSILALLLVLLFAPLGGGPDTAEIDVFALDECENVFYFVTTTEINNYAYRIRGNGWDSGMIYGMQYPSVRGGTYAVQAPTNGDFAGDYTLRVYFDGGYWFENDVVWRVCEWIP